MGTKEKFWALLPDDGRRWLFKKSRIGEADGVVRGEDWAEWLVHHLATLLGVPTALVRPATYKGERGIVSQSVLRSDREELVHGNSLLSASAPDYSQSTKGENPGYTPDAVMIALEDTMAPVDSEIAHLTAFDAWCGYLVLDAWVSGRDRHHENWAIVRSGSERWLAPSFDHGNALGFQERDDRKTRMLNEPAKLHKWAAHGRSRHFSGKPHLADLAQHALELAGPGTASLWRSRLEAVEAESVGDAVAAVPGSIMSETSHRFAVELLNINRRRLLDGHSATKT